MLLEEGQCFYYYKLWGYFVVKKWNQLVNDNRFKEGINKVKNN